MKVKDLIEKLQQLDQERNIWQFYDFPFGVYEPIISVVSEEDEEFAKDRGAKAGDYYFET